MQMPKRNYTLIIAGIILGVVLTKSISIIYAQVVNNVITGCIQNGNGILRVITQGNCQQNETPLSWNQQGPVGATGATGTGGGGSTYVDLANAFLFSPAFNPSYKNFNTVNFSGAILQNLEFLGSTFRSANFTNSVFLTANNSVFAPNTDFTGANFTGAKFNGGDSSSNITSYFSTNFTNANFTNANLRYQNDSIIVGNPEIPGYSPISIGDGVSDFSQAIFTGAIWSNTTCPDGTNSDNNGNTCEGHLSP